MIILRTTYTGIRIGTDSGFVRQEQYDYILTKSTSNYLGVWECLGEWS